MNPVIADSRCPGRPAFRHNLLALAVAALTAATTAQAAGIFGTGPATDFKGRVSVMEAAHPGSTVTLRGRGFEPGQAVQVLNDGQPVTTDQTLRADDKGTFKAQVKVPADAVIGLHPLVVQASNPSAASVQDFKVSTRVPVSGTNAYRIDSRPLKPGVYESAYSAASNALFVTATAGRPPAVRSTLMKVDPQGLKATLAVEPQGKAQAVHGVAVDDTHDTVWVSNTLGDSMAVYRQKDLSLVKQFPVGQVNHSRSIAIDGRNRRAYVASSRGGEIIVFDTEKLEPVGSIYLKSALNKPLIPVTRPMALALDADLGKLYTVSGTTDEAFVIDLATQAVDKMIPLPGARNASGVAVVPGQNLLFVAAQDSDNVLLVDLADGRIRRTLTVGAGALNVLWEPVKQRAYVASRASGTVAVLDIEGRLLANLPAGPLANHLSTDGKGNVFALNKSRDDDDREGDHITRITAR